MDSSAPQIGGELPFRLCLSGHSGHLLVKPLPPVRKETPLSSLPDFVLPPALPKETPESIRESIEHKYLVPSLDHEEDRADRCGKVWDFDWLDEGASILKPTIPRSVVMPVWEPPYRRTKQLANASQTSMDDCLKWIPDFQEVEAARYDEASHNSSSVLRKPGPPEDFVRGSTSNHPFLPGGFDVSISFDKKHAESRTVSDALQVLWDGGQLHTIPPGFPRGLNFEAPEPFSVRRKDAVVSQLVPLVQHDAKGLGQVSLINVFKQAWEQETNSELMHDGKLFLPSF
ncbi:hypothetical protein L7F22_068857 [Adiantum nelumboides]|nr:hypothetical protein [Adiantum nelumboides]